MQRNRQQSPTTTTTPPVRRITRPAPFELKAFMPSCFRTRCAASGNHSPRDKGMISRHGDRHNTFIPTRNYVVVVFPPNILNTRLESLKHWLFFSRKIYDVGTASNIGRLHFWMHVTFSIFFSVPSLPPSYYLMLLDICRRCPENASALNFNCSPYYFYLII